MIKLYYHPSPNPAKIALFLEEAGLPYEMVPVDTRKGDQFKPEFLAINPNAKTPALTDGDVTVFDSNAILLYLAEKTGQFLPQDTPKARGEMLSWLMFVATGIGLGAPVQPPVGNGGSRCRRDSASALTRLQGGAGHRCDDRALRGSAAS